MMENEKRMIEIPADGIIRVPIMQGDSTVGERRIDLSDIPIVDAVEIVHGRWVEADDGDGAVCSICREDFCNIYLEVERFKYCPNCGAKMDGGVEHG